MPETLRQEFDLTTAVGDIAAKMPASTRVFERWRIDYCCAGATALGEACARRGVDAAEVIKALEQLQDDEESPSFLEVPLSELSDYIIRKHHHYTREETELLVELSAKVRRVHGENHPEVIPVARIVAALQPELFHHMMKEEQILFPFVADMEEAAANGSSRSGGLTSIEDPIRMMMFEHDQASEMLQELRTATGDYHLPPDACMSFRALYQRLQDLERDIHQHIHLENNIYFPRALELERTVSV
jgi:regulator of cell morphogenesis and NO signaling